MCQTYCCNYLRLNDVQMFCDFYNVFSDIDYGVFFKTDVFRKYKKKAEVFTTNSAIWFVELMVSVTFWMSEQSELRLLMVLLRYLMLTFFCTLFLENRPTQQMTQQFVWASKVWIEAQAKISTSFHHYIIWFHQDFVGRKS